MMLKQSCCALFGEPNPSIPRSTAHLVQESARASLPRQQPRRAFLFATVKGITGHQESGAGVAGLMEASMLLHGGMVPPALHLRHLNPHVHGALAGHAVSIARGGPYGVPCTQATVAGLAGVSSFGAQGTNAHALLAGTGAAATIANWTTCSPLPWRRTRCYVAATAQLLLTACLLRRHTRSGNVTFDTNLSAAQLAYLWQHGVHGTAFLPAPAVLSIAASSLPLMGAVVKDEDTGAASSTAAVVEAAMVAPAVLPQPAAARVAPAVVRVKLVGATGAVEAALDDQQLLAARLATSPVTALAPKAAAAGRRSTKERIQLKTSLGAGWPLAPAGATAEACLSAADAAGYATHPALLDACLGQAASLADTEAVPLLWVRSVAALLVSSGAAPGGSLTAVYQPVDGWQWGSASMPGTAVLGAVLGGHDRPPASPGPRSLLSARAGAGRGGGEAGDEEAVGVPTDHPLLQMPEEERLLHLQAQVGAAVPERAHGRAACSRVGSQACPLLTESASRARHNRS